MKWVSIFRISRLTIFLWTLVGVSFLLSALGSSRTPRLRFLLFSDLHFDPFYGTEKGYGPPGHPSDIFGEPLHDSSIELVKAVTNMIRASSINYTFYLGDLLRHEAIKLGSDGIREAWRTASGELSSGLRILFPNSPENISKESGLTLPFLGCLGNNDFFEDYVFDVESQGDFLEYQGKIWRENGFLSEAEAKNFSKHGYFFRDILFNDRIMANRNVLRVVVLNALVWSPLLKPRLSKKSSKGNYEDPMGQLEFLDSLLQEASEEGNYSVYILMHIPPVINLYEVQKKHHTHKVVKAFSHLARRFHEAFFEIVKRNSGQIKMILCGHTHLFTILADEDLGVPIFTVPSVSPILGNRPSFLIVETDPISYEPITFTQTYLAEGEWTDGTNDFRLLWGWEKGVLSNITLLRKQIRKLFLDDYKWNGFQAAQLGGTLENTSYQLIAFEKECLGFCRESTICQMLTGSPDSFELCLEEQKNFGSLLKVKFLVMGIFLLISFIVYRFLE